LGEYESRARLVRFLDILLITVPQIETKVTKPHRNTAAELSQEIIKLRLSLAKHLKPSKYISNTLREIRNPMIKKFDETKLAPNKRKF